MLYASSSSSIGLNSVIYRKKGIGCDRGFPVEALSEKGDIFSSSPIILCTRCTKVFEALSRALRYLGPHKAKPAGKTAVPLGDTPPLAVMNTAGIIF